MPMALIKDVIWVLVIAAACVGFVALEKYGPATRQMPDRAFCLEAYDGGPYVVDRIDRGTQALENLSVSILRGIQPDKLAEIHSLTNGDSPRGVRRRQAGSRRENCGLPVAVQID